MSKIKQVLWGALVCSFPVAAHADLINFIDMADNGAQGESAWAPLALSFADFTVTITGGETSAGYAYLDTGNAGLGVCKQLNNAADANQTYSELGKSRGGNLCSPSSDDNVTTDEWLSFVFDVDVIIDNLWFNNNHDGGFNAGDLVSIAGSDYSVQTGYAGGANGIGSFSVSAGESLIVKFVNEQFYLSGMSVNAVPEPGSLALLGLGLMSMSFFRRKKTN